MSGARERFEYYWKEERVVPRRNYRPTGKGKWPSLGEELELLVAKIEDNSDGLKIEKGPAFTPNRLIDAVLHCQKLPLRGLSFEIGRQIPSSIIRSIEEHTQSIERSITYLYKFLGDEDRSTGAFFSRLCHSWEIDDWRVVITTQNYSTKIKEPRLGADAGIIIDIANRENQRIVKAAWFQAKRVDSLPRNIRDLPRMAEQLDTMRARTQDAYGLIYTPHEVVVLSANGMERLSPHQLFPQILKCLRGDSEPSVLVDTLDSKFVLEVLITSS